MQHASNLAYGLPDLVLPRIIRHWQPKIRFEIKQGRYLIKTADSEEEFLATLRLRSDVFLGEFASKSYDATSDLNLDLDEIDADADFLIIKDSVTGEVFASYRLISSEFSKNFYSHSEFILHDFLATPGHKLELSRACIRADKRTSGIFLHLLWKGLARYIQLCDATYLFGCSSVQTLRLPDLVATYHALRDLDALSNSLNIVPHHNFRLLDVKNIFHIPLSEKIHAIDLPPLLMGYIKAGAKVYGEPAYDHDFGCLDLFTILDCKAPPSAFLKRYLEGQ